MRCHWLNDFSSLHMFTIHCGVRSVAAGARPFMAMLACEKGLATIGVRRYASLLAELLNKDLGCCFVGMGSSSQRHCSANCQIEK